MSTEGERDLENDERAAQTDASFGGNAAALCFQRVMRFRTACLEVRARFQRAVP